MSQASDYLENAIANSLFGKTSDLGAFASAPTIYLALVTTAPTDSMTGTTITETTYTGYARKQTTAANWDAASAGVVANGAELAFPASTGLNSSPLITHFAACDAATAGNLLFFGTMGSSLSPTSGVTPKFEIGDITTAVQ